MWQLAKNQYHLGQAMLANLIYMFPSRKLKIVGVTGTDGKTTTASLIYHILINSGYKASLITTVGAVINHKTSDIGFHVTTPGRFALQSYLSKSKKSGVEYVILELTSHALDQYRAFGIPIEVGVLTNVTNEHLDYHKTYDKYILAKLKLLKKAKIAILNKDDASYQKIKEFGLGTRNKKVITYGLGSDSDINPNKFKFKTKLIGKFNEYNALAAISVALELGVGSSQIRDSLVNYTPPKGRQEIVYDQGFTVINDFAHTPNSFLSLLPEIKKVTRGRLIHVFGAAGKRDKYKRAEMGKTSSEFSDVIVLTAEDPRDESVNEISSEIESGIADTNFEVLDLGRIEKSELRIKENLKYIVKISNRKDAIEFAISIARNGDTVLLTGKGHEKSINYGKGEEAWDENRIALQAIESRIKNQESRIKNQELRIKN